MFERISKRAVKWSVVVLAVVGLAAFFAMRYVKARRAALPEGIVAGNGRLEAKQVDAAAKEPLRVEHVLVEEGALVHPGQILVELDTATLETELAEANASVVAERERVAVAEASIVQRKSEISLAEIEVERATELVADGAGSQRELDVRQTRLETTRASLAEAKAMLRTAKQKVEVAKQGAATLQTRIDDATLRSPVTGRVLYRLAEPGEVLAPGGNALTIVDMEDVYMEIFLPSELAGKVQIGAEARIVLDHAPDRIIPGYVSFVSPEAQFTPKQVETASERQKLMFRVKIQIPKELARKHVEDLKTGVRGVGYIRFDTSVPWPARLQVQAPSTPSAALP